MNKKKAMRARVYVTLKNGVLDPQGKAVQQALERLSFNEVDDVRVGKLIELTVRAQTKAAAKKRIDAMCEKLLSNPVIESYSYEIQ